MRKLLLVALMSLSFSAYALTTVTNIPVNGYTNVAFMAGAPATVSYIILAPTAGNAGSVDIRDWDTAVAKHQYTNAAYTTVSSYATNYYSVWTNYYGVVNYSGTNVALIQVTNTVAASTNNIPIALSLSTATNTTTEFTGLNLLLLRGMTVTNKSSAAVTLTVGYSQ